VAVRLPQPRHCAPRTAEKAVLRCLGVFYPNQLNPKRQPLKYLNSKNLFGLRGKNKKKESKSKFRFQKKKVQALRVFKKISTL
jgi:hypothetical protein